MRQGPRSAQGYTLLELLVVIAIIALVTGALAMILYQLLNAPRQGNAQLAVDGDLRNAGLWLMRDGNEAWDFTPGALPVYGTFLITRTGSTTASVTYRFAAGTLWRDHTTAAGTATYGVARHLEQASDVTFTPGSGTVVVEVTATSGEDRNQISASQTYTVALRAQ